MVSETDVEQFPQTDKDALQFLEDLEWQSEMTLCAVQSIYDVYRRNGKTIKQALFNALDHACREPPRYPLEEGQ